LKSEAGQLTIDPSCNSGHKLQQNGKKFMICSTDPSSICHVKSKLHSTIMMPQTQWFWSPETMQWTFLAQQCQLHNLLCWTWVSFLFLSVFAATLNMLTLSLFFDNGFVKWLTLQFGHADIMMRTTAMLWLWLTINISMVCLQPTVCKMSHASPPLKQKTLICQQHIFNKISNGKNKQHCAHILLVNHHNPSRTYGKASQRSDAKGPFGSVLCFWIQPSHNSIHHWVIYLFVVLTFCWKNLFGWPMTSPISCIFVTICLSFGFNLSIKWCFVTQNVHGVKLWQGLCK